MAVINRTAEPAAADSAATEEAAPAATTTEAPVATTRGATARTRAGTRVAAVGAETSVMLARVIRTVAGIVALIIALGIAFVVLKASPSNTIVSHIHSWAHWLAGPFNGMFHLHSARGTVALNWAIALVVYLAIGSLLARLVLTPARAFRRRGTAAV
jgi:hypothetical protein